MMDDAINDGVELQVDMLPGVQMLLYITITQGTLDTCVYR